MKTETKVLEFDKFNKNNTAISKEVAIGTLYDINKAAMKNASMITKQQLNKVKRQLKDFFELKNYVMLLCNERKDYTVFHNKFKEFPIVAVDELMETLNNRGVIQSIEEQDDGAFEIWLKIEDEPFVYYLFNYEFGVIEY